MTDVLVDLNIDSYGNPFNINILIDYKDGDDIEILAESIPIFETNLVIYNPDVAIGSDITVATTSLRMSLSFFEPEIIHRGTITSTISPPPSIFEVSHLDRAILSELSQTQTSYNNSQTLNLALELQSISNNIDNLSSGKKSVWESSVINNVGDRKTIKKLVKDLIYNYSTPKKNRIK